MFSKITIINGVVVVIDDDDDDYVNNNNKSNTKLTPARKAAS